MVKTILIHGLGQDASSWNKVRSYFTKQDEVLCPDWIDLLHGGEVTWNNLYQAFEGYCESIAEPLNLCGLSLGAVLALQYAAEHPEKVNSLVLIAPQYKMPKLLLRFQNMIFRLMPDRAFWEMKLKKQDVIRLTRSMMELDFSGERKKICCDTLILCGEKDAANKKAAYELASAMPKAAVRLVKGAGHEVNTDAPQLLAQILESYYQGCGSTVS